MSYDMCLWRGSAAMLDISTHNLQVRKWHRLKLIFHVIISHTLKSADSKSLKSSYSFRFIVFSDYVLNYYTRIRHGCFADMQRGNHTNVTGRRSNHRGYGWLYHMNDKQRFLTPGHQGWNDLHSLCRIGMEYYLLNNDDNNIIYWIMMIIMIMMMMIIIMIIMMTMMIIGTATIMIMIIIITTTLTMTIMKMIMIKTAQTPCQSLYKDRRI